jgi:predicted small secreted protein
MYAKFLRFGFLCTLLALFSQPFLVGCNTISGMGEDIEEAGDAVGETIEDEDGDDEY